MPAKLEFSTELWHRTKQAADRYLAQLCRTRRLAPVARISPSGNVRMVAPAQLTHGKAAEFQRRAVVHFHALIRLDGVHLRQHVLRQRLGDLEQFHLRVRHLLRPLRHGLGELVHMTVEAVKDDLDSRRHD